MGNRGCSYSAKVAQARAKVLTQQANFDNSEQGEGEEVNTLANAQVQLDKVRPDLRRTDALIAVVARVRTDDR